MKTFKTNPQGFRNVKRKIFIKTFLLGLISIIAGIFIFVVNQQESESYMSTILIVFPVLLVFIVAGAYRGIKRQEKLWNSYQLIINGEYIKRLQKNVPDIMIRKDEITKIVKLSDENIFIKTNQPKHFIFVPFAIENRDELLKELADFGEIKKQEKKGIKISYKFVTFLTLALMVIFFTLKERYIIIPSGIVLTVGLIWSFLEIQKSKHLDKRTKRSSYFIFILLFTVIGRIVFVILGMA